jgi:hypothetical protein
MTMGTTDKGWRMDSDLPERLETWISIELGIAGIYHAFSRMFAEAEGFWADLARQEENHATILIVGKRYIQGGQLPQGMVPASLPHMKSTLQLIEAFRKEIAVGRVSPERAQQMGLALEETIEEGYLLEVMTGKTDSEIISRLQRLLLDTRSHVLRIRTFVEKGGYP